VERKKLPPNVEARGVNRKMKIEDSKGDTGKKHGVHRGKGKRRRGRKRGPRLTKQAPKDRET